MFVCAQDAGEIVGVWTCFHARLQVKLVGSSTLCFRKERTMTLRDK